ncbi:sensor domain-containing diguanylate cyclase [Sphingomonas sp. PAMC 26605]|uniref:sensor domain-containing diguanylate cyclase n=1 Tax=Sphingomonas sp. PAMC 26605 TaxID=1112214 RepID=UPI00026CD7EF|nr:sensor domain-containing diguanylate cyclase [Sphingomonas sp. PAMC 26605]
MGGEASNQIATKSVIATSVGYFVVAAATVSTTRFDGGVAFLWVATAFLIARLATLRPSAWPAHLLACGSAGAAVTALFGLGVAAAVPLAIVNLSEAVIAAALLRHIQIPEHPLESMRWLAGFVLTTGMLAPAVSGVGGASVAAIITGADFTASFARWFAGHSLGSLTFTPLFMLLFRDDFRGLIRATTRKRAAETAVLLLLVVGMSFAVFDQDSMSLLFLPFLPVIFATFRGGPLTAAMAVVLLTIVGCTLTLQGLGPISLLHGTMGDHMQFLQFYLAATVLTVLPISADLARRSNLIRELRDSKARYRMLADNSTDIILNLDIDGRVRFVSPSITQLGGFEPSDLVGQNAALLVVPEDRPSAAKSHVMTLRGGGAMVSFEYRAFTASGAERWFETHSRAVCDDAGVVEGVVSVLRDISDRKVMETQLFHAALTDPLTQLPNRRAFKLELDGLVEHVDPTRSFGCVAMFDFDHFKQVNDNHGHEAGDRILREFGRIAMATVRGGDVVSRIGGEEFAVLLRHASLEQAVIVCERLRIAIEEMVIMVDGRPVRVTASGGVASIDAGGAEGVLRSADAALYQAKRDGRNRLRLAA